MNTSKINTSKLDILGNKLARDALILLIDLYPQIRSTSDQQREAACAAMRAISRSTIDTLIDDASDAPWVGHLAYQTAALTLAQAGIKALKAACASTGSSDSLSR